MNVKKNLNPITSKPKPIRFNVFFLLTLLLLITTFVYHKSINNKFTGWDDPGYITENQDIKTLHGDSINYTLKKTFSSYVEGNYHPITMLVYCLEYEKFHLNPKAYHAVSLILHLFNTLLVFGFIWLLTKQQLVAFITALLFSIHPMHVESVAWASELKDVLYSFFYLAALCTYILYLKKANWQWLLYIVTFLLFVLGLLSKAMAVSLPITFFIVDYFFARKFNLKMVIEKAPFLLLSLIFGCVAIVAQKSESAMSDITNNHFLHQILFSSYALLTYLWKLILPINLTCFYPYPVKENALYPIIYYIAPLLVIGLIVLIYKSQKFGKGILFGFAFFLITIILVLQIIPVGSAMMAERYTYLPYIGLFFILANLINNLLQNSKLNNAPKFATLSALIIFIAILCYLTVRQCKVWKDGLSIWNNAIEKNDKVAFAYNCRGSVYYVKKDYNNALFDFSHAIQLQTDYVDAYFNRGLVNNNLKNYNDAITDYSISIQYRPKYAPAYHYRGSTNYNLRKYDLAIADFNQAILLKYIFPDAYYNRGLAHYNLGNYTAAMEDFTTAIQLNSKHAEAYAHRGMSQYMLKNYEQALEDNAIAIQINPLYAVAYDYRAGIYFSIQDFKAAWENILKAQQLGFKVDPKFMDAIQEGIKYTNNKKVVIDKTL